MTLYVYIVFFAINHFYLTVVVCAVVITGDTADEVYSNVKDVIRDQSGPVVWIPSGDPL